MYTIYEYLNFLLIGYAISTFTFLIGVLFLNRLKELKKDYLNIANLFALVLIIVVTLVSTIHYYNNYRSDSQNDFTFAADRRHYYLFISLTAVVSLLFLFGRLRKNTFVTLFVIAVSNWFVFYDTLYIWVTSFYMDYLHSAWSVEYAESPWPNIIASTIVYGGLVWMLVNMKEKRSR